MSERLPGSGILGRGQATVTRAARYRRPWVAPGWAVDGNGRAYNTPALGAELLTNGDMETWSSATNAGTWAEAIGGTSTINREATTVHGGSFALRMDIDASNTFTSAAQVTALALGQWVAMVGWLRASTSGKTSRMELSGLVGPALNPGAAWTRYVQTNRATSAAQAFQVARGSAVSGSLYFDDLSAKPIPTANLFATIAGASSSLPVAAQLATLTPGTQIGIVSRLDDPSNPQNYVAAWYNGTGNLILEKIVGGAITPLQSNAVAFAPNDWIEIRWPTLTTCQLWVNGIQIGSDRTVADSGIVANKYHGLLSPHSENLFTQFQLGGYHVPFAF